MLILFTYFINSGCLIYPIKFSCFENLSWSIPLLEVSQMNDWYKLWSKAGAGPNFRVENPEIYIQGFNWVSNWIDNYFLQCTFYAQAWFEMTGEQIKKIVIIMASEDGHLEIFEEETANYIEQLEHTIEEFYHGPLSSL